MKILVTGGAGFIGSHLVDSFVEDGHDVVVLDDLSTGHQDNVHPKATFVLGDIAEEDTVRQAMRGVEMVFHEAAHGSVLRSVLHPLSTDRANVRGSLTVLQAAVDAGVRRLVYASSSSVYGGAGPIPTPESAPTRPRSPYAVTKLAAEHYCRVFSELHPLETVGLRYFNVYGPRQRSDSAYAAVIPLFIDCLIRGEAPTVHGDGLQRRDFTYVSDVVAANRAAAVAPGAVCNGSVYNAAGGRDRSLLDLLDTLGDILGVHPAPRHSDPRPGDIRTSRADASAIRRDLGYEATITFEEGMRRTVAWFSAR